MAYFYGFAIRLFRIISIPSKCCYFRPRDHVILMECINRNYSAIVATLPIIYNYMAE
jgi:hypothetical protein